MRKFLFAALSAATLMVASTVSMAGTDDPSDDTIHQAGTQLHLPEPQGPHPQTSVAPEVQGNIDKANRSARGGTDVGGGGNIVILPDDTIHMADAYVQHPERQDPHEYKDLSPELRGEIEKSTRMLVRYGAAVEKWLNPDLLGRWPHPPELIMAEKGGYTTRNAQAGWFREQIWAPEIRYVFTDKIPETCHPVGDIGPVPNGYRVVEVGCTEGNTTFILKQYFDKMSLREQALAMIHERMHGILGQKPHGLVTSTTQGLGLVLDLAQKQKQGNRPVLSNDDLSVLNYMVDSIDQLGLTGNGVPQAPYMFSHYWVVTANGGGIYSKQAKVDPAAYLGVGAMLGDGGSMEAGSELVNSTCFLASCELHGGASIVDSVIAPEPGAQVGYDDFETNVFHATFAKGSKVVGSVLQASQESSTQQRVVLREASSVMNSELLQFSSFDLGAGSEITSVHLPLNPFAPAMIRLDVQDRASLSNLTTPIFAGNPRTKDGTEFVVTVLADHKLDFSKSSVPFCQDTKHWLRLTQSVSLENEDSLRSVCVGTGF